MRDVVITGLGVNCAAGRNFIELSAAFRAGRHGMSPLAGIPPARGHDRAAQLKSYSHAVPGRLRRIARPAIAEAIRHARLERGDLAGAALYLATVAGDGLGAEGMCAEIMAARRGGRRLRAAIATFPGMTLAARLARDCGIGGPCDVNTNACASGAIAVARAMHAIALGKIDRAVVCGADQLKPITYYGADRSGILGPKILPFHRDRCGTVLGDGAGALILEAAASARVRGQEPIAWLRGYGSSCSNDPHEIVPQMDGGGIARSIAAALHDAAIDTDAIDYLNAHATGTVNIEISEYEGIRTAFGPLAETIPVNATKSYTGHLSSASAVIELIATIDVIASGFIPETLGLDIPDPAFALAFVPAGGIAAEVANAVSLAMGAGGVNTAIVVAAPRLLDRRTAPRARASGSPARVGAISIVGDGARAPHGNAPDAPRPIVAVSTPRSDFRCWCGTDADSEYNLASLLALAAVNRLVAAAGLSRGLLTSQRTALVVGTALGGSATWSHLLATTYHENPRLILPSMALSHGAHLAATLISRRHRMIGPTVTLTSGEAAGVAALDYACDLIALDRIDRAIVCATDIADDPTRRGVALTCGRDAADALADGAAAMLVERRDESARGLDLALRWSPMADGDRLAFAPSAAFGGGARARRARVAKDSPYAAIPDCGAARGLIALAQACAGERAPAGGGVISIPANGGVFHAEIGHDGGPRCPM